MPLSPRLLRPRASGTAVHPDALDWVTRVTTNGGTVSSNTLAAVSTFCASINAAGIRDRFYRLNLFCGDQLAAALVPLYRAESLTASARGLVTDTNNNFVGTDFNNTGSSAGLQGNGSTKSLLTGVPGNVTAAANLHLSADIRSANTQTSFRSIISVYRARQAGETGSFGGWLANLDARTGSTNRCCTFGVYGPYSGDFGTLINASDIGAGHLVGAWPTFYRNGAPEGTDATTSITYPDAHGFAVFGGAHGAAQTVGERVNARISAYSIGQTMTASQVSAYTTAMSAFRSALNRT